jgi:hypothetical protein
MEEDRRMLGLTESIEEAERLFIEDFDTWDMTGYYLYSKLWRSGLSAHIGTWGAPTATAPFAAEPTFPILSSKDLAPLSCEAWQDFDLAPTDDQFG